MNNVLEFFIKMKDMMSSGLVKLANNAKQKFGDINNYIDNVVKKNRDLENSFNRTGSSIGNWARNIGLAVTAVGLLSFGKGAIHDAMNFQATQKSFEVLLGDKTKGQALSGQLNKLQQDTILGPEVFKNAQTMLGFGLEPEKVIPSIKMLGDISMGSAERMASLTLAFSQVQAAGKLTGQDLIQFVNAGFNPLNEISKTTGQSMADLKKKMEEGAITFKMVEDSVISATSAGGLYNDMMNQLAETPMGKLQQLQGQFEAFKVKVGMALMPVANFLIKTAGFLMDNAHSIKMVGIALISYVSYMKLAAFWTNNFGGAAEFATIRTRLLNAVMSINPIGLLISGLSVLTASLFEYSGQVSEVITKQKMLDNMTLDVKKSVIGETLAAQRRIEKIRDHTVSMKDQLSALTELKNMSDTYFGKLTLETTQTEAATKALQDYSKAIEQNAMIKAAENKLVKLEEQYIDYKDIYDSVMKNSGFKYKQTATAYWNQYVQDYQGRKSSLTAIASQRPIDIKPTFGGGNNNNNSTNTGKEITTGITGGGPRVVNITVGKMIEKIEIKTNTLPESLEIVEKQVEETLLRVLNSGASLQ